MHSRLIIAAGDVSSSPVLAKHFQGKIAKEVYRCGKGIFLTGSVAKPLGFAAAQVPAKLTKNVVYSAVGQVGEAAIGYVSTIGVVRFLYKVVHPAKLKTTARLAYNVACLPMTIYSMGVSRAFDILKLSKLEEMWFGHPVYIFDDNRLWIEKNFTIGDIFDKLED